MIIQHSLRAVLVASLGSFLVVGCSAGIPEGRFACTTASECPPGQECGTDGLCRTNASAIDTGTPAVDGGMGHDAGTGCTRDLECDDHVFCNGSEMCTGGACVMGASPCTGSQACHEVARTCTMATCTTDMDNDTFIAASCGGPDCNDDNAAVHPGVAETCDGVDNDCDGTVDDPTASMLCPALHGTDATCTAGACHYACNGTNITCDSADPGDSTGCEIDKATDPSHCGSCGNVCPSTMHQTSTCNLTCVTVCDANYMDCNHDITDGCETRGMTCDLDPPRLIGPTDEMLVTSNRPVFRFVIGSGSTAGHVEVCMDEGCATVVMSMTGTSPLTATGTLAPGHYFWRARGASATFVAARASTVWGISTFARTSGPSADAFPYLDIDHGMADLVVGAPSTTAGGYVRVYDGATGTFTQTLMAGVPGFGAATAAAGDVNGDGFGDVIVGSCIGTWTTATVPTACQTTAYLYPGVGDGTLGAPWLINAPAGATGFGNTVSAAGDVNGDGYADVVIGAYYAGRAYLVMGGAGGPSSTLVTLGFGTTSYGAAVSFAGDVNADGYDDVVVGEPNDGVLFLYLGQPTGMPLEVRMTVGASGYAASVSGVGDWNGDGYADFAVSTFDSPGSLEIRLGGASISPTSPPVPVAMFMLPNPGGGGTGGASVTGLGDCDGDGLGDVVSATYDAIGGTLVMWRGNSAGGTPPQGMFHQTIPFMGRNVGRLAGSRFVASACSATAGCTPNVTEYQCMTGTFPVLQVWTDSGGTNFGAGLMR